MGDVPPPPLGDREEYVEVPRAPWTTHAPTAAPAVLCPTCALNWRLKGTIEGESQFLCCCAGLASGALSYDAEVGARDDAAAAHFYLRAAERGDVHAEFNMGVVYADGLGGVARDDAAANRMFERAAAKKCEEAEAVLEFRQTNRSLAALVDARGPIEPPRHWGLAKEGEAPIPPKDEFVDPVFLKMFVSPRAQAYSP